MSDESENFYLTTPNGDIKLEQLPIHRSEAEKILHSIENPKEGTYIIWVSGYIEPHPDNPINGSFEEVFFIFEKVKECSTFYLQKASFYNPETVMLSDIEHYAQKIKKVIDKVKTKEINLNIYSESNERHNEMLVDIKDENKELLMSLSINFSRHVPFELIKLSYIKNNGLWKGGRYWFGEINIPSIYAALYVIKLITLQLTGSSIIQQTTAQSEKDYEFIE